MEPLKIIEITEDHIKSNEFAKVINENFKELKSFMESREQIVTSTAQAALKIVKELRTELKNNYIRIDNRINDLEDVLENLITELKPPSQQLLIEKIKKSKK